MHGPFLGSDAVKAGLVNRYQLGTHFDRVFHNVYVTRGHQLTAVEKARAAWLFAGGRGIVAGVSAAAVHGDKWISASEPAELIQSSRFRTPGLLLHSDTVAAAEVCSTAGMQVTTPARTAFDLGRRRGLTLAVIRIDALIQATGVSLAEIADLTARHPGTRGIVQLRTAITLADPGAESPQETRTRLVLTEAGLRPETQIEVHDDHGQFVGRLDMGWRRWKVGVEYDGIHHWTDPDQRRRDIDRWSAFEDARWRIVRVGQDMLRYRRPTIVQRATAALHAAGWRPT